jgi:homoserine acetyltransferase
MSLNWSEADITANCYIAIRRVMSAFDPKRTSTGISKALPLWRLDPYDAAPELWEGQ